MNNFFMSSIPFRCLGLHFFLVIILELSYRQMDNTPLGLVSRSRIQGYGIPRSWSTQFVLY